MLRHQTYLFASLHCFAAAALLFERDILHLHFEVWGTFCQTSMDHHRLSTSPANTSGIMGDCSSAHSSTGNLNSLIIGCGLQHRSPSMSSSSCSLHCLGMTPCSAHAQHHAIHASPGSATGMGISNNTSTTTGIGSLSSTPVSVTGRTSNIVNCCCQSTNGGGSRCSSISMSPAASPCPPPDPVLMSPSDNVIIQRLQSENRSLKMEIESLKLKVKSLMEDKRHIQEAAVSIQARAEQEEEFISNTLLKKIQMLKKEKETLAINYEQEEECLTNDLSRQLNQLREEKVQLEKTLEHETQCRSGGRSRSQSVNE